MKKVIIFLLLLISFYVNAKPTCGPYKLCSSCVITVNGKYYIRLEIQAGVGSSGCPQMPTVLHDPVTNTTMYSNIPPNYSTIAPGCGWSNSVAYYDYFDISLYPNLLTPILNQISTSGLNYPLFWSNYNPNWTYTFPTPANFSLKDTCAPIVTDEPCDADFRATFYSKNSSQMSLVANSYDATSTYDWYLDGNLIANGTGGFSIIGMSAGQHSICLTVTTINGKVCKKCMDFCVTKDPKGGGWDWDTGDGGDDDIPKTIQKNKSQPTVEKNIKIERAFKFLMFPNPTTDQLNIITNTTKDEILIITIFDNLGKIRQTEKAKVVTGQNKIKLNLVNYTSGMYFIEVSTGKEKWKEKLSIIK
jgi:hypothetical protein